MHAKIVATVDLHQTNNQNMVSTFDRSEPLINLALQSEESFGLMIEREREHLPKDDYLKRLRSGELDLGVRREALDWIWKAHAHYNFGPLSVYLSMNYLDRFLSVYELPRGKTWTVQLLAVACLSLATKVEETKVPMTVDLQVGEPKFVFEGKTIQRMELLVLSALKWRMQACTPCSFIDYFLRKINDDQFPSGSLISRSVQLILRTIKGIDFLEFRPSEIAGAVAMSVSGEIQASNIDKAMSCFIHVEKGRVLKCLELIQDLTLISGSDNVGGASVPSVPQSPVGVLDAACLSYKSDAITVKSFIIYSESLLESRGQNKRYIGVAMSAEELKIRGELELEIERDLEAEIKDGIYQLALRLHRLYHHQKERNARELSESGNKNHGMKSKILSEVNISIKMEGGTRIEVQEIKKEAPANGRPRTSRSENMQGMVAAEAKKFDWVKTLRSAGTSPLAANKNNDSFHQKKVLQNKPNFHQNLTLELRRNSTSALRQRKRNMGSENKLLALGWRS
ncbi:hypothetical protein F0562_003172 [Nyssa sinensis]|uniref:Uncharacterized protein n=1 Tax=Nyssa sinensis TaxID=561372 RepID=A0A5J5BUE8_9ASTE|nr:hypothetical protein F0562_003172 [Nyssa sinensis]